MEFSHKLNNINSNLEGVSSIHYFPHKKFWKIHSNVILLMDNDHLVFLFTMSFLLKATTWTLTK